MDFFATFLLVFIAVVLVGLLVSESEVQKLRERVLLFENHSIWAIGELRKITGKEWYFSKEGIRSVGECKWPNLKQYNFDELVPKLKDRGLPFIFIERNPNGVDYQIFTSNDDEFEIDDLCALIDGIKVCADEITIRLIGSKNEARA